jgi:HD-GYP domain-containing protein (c-di-GMP phosphodiesterase class II)
MAKSYCEYSDGLLEQVRSAFSYLEVPSFQRALSENVLKALGSRSLKTKDHCMDVALMSMNAAKVAGIHPRLVFCPALTHDIGKLKIDSRLLLKKSSDWTKEDAIQMQKHVFYGYYFLKDFDNLMANAALFHHKQIRGYPLSRELRNHSIESRAIKLIGLVDAYEALTHRAVCKSHSKELRPMTREEACSLIIEKTHESRLIKDLYDSGVF